VAALSEHDQCDEVWALFSDGKKQPTAVIEEAAAQILEKELALAPGTVTIGKMVSSLRQLGFEKVYDAKYFRGAVIEDENRELLGRIKKDQKKKLPMITGCSPGWLRFARNFYPDLEDHFFASGSNGMPSAGPVVSVIPCVAKKFNETRTGEAHIVLTPRELARMFRLAGICFENLPEEPADFPAQNAHGLPSSDGAKTITVNGFSDARRIMDSIRCGECDAAHVRIMSCPAGCVMDIRQTGIRP
jgi:NADH-quinone oxidoreductase subunit G/NADP-reducing hydrogenase subunit HndD